MRLDELDYTYIDGIRCCMGHVLPYGASLIYEGAINFSVSSHDATACTLLLYHQGAAEPYATIPIPEHYRMGDCYAIIVYNQDIEDLEYTYRFDGPFDVARGMRFDASRDLIDPYASLICGRDSWTADTSCRPPMRGKVILDDFIWEGDNQLGTRLEDLVIYEMHVRGLTFGNKSTAKYKGTYHGVIEMIPYFKRLGINCVELLPVFEFDDTEYSDREGVDVRNYWGYSTVGFFAPKSAYASSGKLGLACDELKYMVKKLHEANISVILDVVYNHTAEGGEGGPTYSYRGIDNNTYYILDDEGRYRDFTGCANTVNCNNAVVRGHILDSLRYWVSNYHVDGFRFDEAAILMRGQDGQPMQHPPLLEKLAHDPILSRTILIAEAWDAAGLYAVGNMPVPDRWSEWNGLFRDCVRHFIKSDAYVGPELLKRIEGSPELYEGKRHQTINFVTCHDGFTLNDLVSYNAKHNEANGEGNRDGIDDNLSWNCGVEGPTDDEEVEALRNRQVKNALALLLLSRGTPMMLMGDEFRNSQMGNNNAYCQDSQVSWLDWADLERHADVFEFCRLMIELRHTYEVIRNPTLYTGVNGTGYPELSFHGAKPFNLGLNRPFHTFGFMYAQHGTEDDPERDVFIYCGVNAYWETRTIELPEVPHGHTWHKYVYTPDRDHSVHPEVTGSVTLEPRSLCVLVAS